MYCNCEFENKQVDNYTIRSFKSKDRKLLSEFEHNINQFVVYFVANCIVAVNGKELDNQERKRLLAKRMERGDIFNAFYEIKKFTKNKSVMNIQGRCTYCQETFDTEFDTDRLNRTENKDPQITLELPYGLEKNVNGQDLIHKDLVMNKPTGQTLIDMGNIDDIFESVGRGISSCIVRLGELETVSYYDLDELEYEDIRTIEKAWTEQLGGVQSTITLRCPRCKKKFESEFIVKDFFD
jgi:hypothetical protein